MSANHAPACKAFLYPGMGDCTCGALKTRPKSSWELRAETAEAELARIQQLARCFKLEDILDDPHNPSETTQTLRAFELAATLRRQLVKAESERTELRAAARLAIDVIGNTRDELGLKIEAEKAYLALLAVIAVTEAE